MSKHKNGQNFGKIIFACIFLFNPFFGIIDLLPDFIGLMLLYSAVSHMSLINGYFAEARAYVRKAMYVSIVRAVFSFILLANNFIVSETLLLLYLFVFSVVDLIFLIPAVLRIKQGMQYFTVYHSSSAIEASAFGDSKFTKTDLMCGYTVFFAVIHALFSVLPEFTVLFKPDDFEQTSNFATNLYYRIGTFRLISVLVITVLGIVWFICAVVYFSKIRADKEFISAIERVYNEKGYKTKNANTEKSLKSGMLLMFFGMVFGFNLFIDDVNILPDLISAVLFLSALSKLNGFIKKSIPAKVLSYCCIALSLAKSIIEIIFTSDYSYTQIPRYADAVKIYTVLNIINFFESVVYFALVVCVLSAVKEIITGHTGFLPCTAEKGILTDKIKVLHKKLIMRSNVIAVFSGLKCASSIFYYISRVNYGWYFDLAFTYDVVLTGLCVVFSGVLFKSISDEISSRYLINR